MEYREPSKPLSKIGHPRGSSIRLLIAYDGPDAAKRATNLRNRLAIRIELELEMEEVTWSFALLKHPELCKEAARQAAGADVVIVAPDRSAGLPEHAFAWLREWLRKKSGGKRALVALLASGEDCSASHSPVATALGQMAENAGLDFFCGFGCAPESFDGLELGLPSDENRHCGADSILLDLFGPATKASKQPRGNAPPNPVARPRWRQ